MERFRDIVDAWPSLQSFADDIGVAYGTAQVARHRDSISPVYFGRIVRAARARRIKGITHELLHDLYEAKHGREPRPKGRMGNGLELSPA